MKLQHALMAIALAVGVWLAFFLDKSPDSDVVGAVVKPNAQKIGVSSAGAKIADADKPAATVAGAATKSYGRTDRVIPILALAPRDKLISVGHVGLDGKKLPISSQIFATQSWLPAPVVDTKLVNTPPPVPTAPPLNFTYVGKKFEEGVWEVYLAKRNNYFIARAQDVIDGNYRVDAVNSNTVTFTYLPLNQVQRLNIKG